MDDFENGAGKDNNETEEERQKNASKENETEVKLMQESIKRERIKKEKFINRRSNGPSNKSQVKVIEKTGAKTGENTSLGNKRKLEEDEEFITPMKRQKAVAPKQESGIHQKPSKAAPNPTLAKTEYPSDGDQKPRNKKEAQKDNSETRGRYRALRINAEPGHASHHVRESHRSSDNTAAEERLETSKKKLQAGYQAHERAKRNIQLIPEGGDQKNASTSRSSKNQTRK